MSETSSIASDISDISTLDDELVVLSSGTVLQNGYSSPRQLPSEDNGQFSPISKKATNGIKHIGRASSSTDIEDEVEIVPSPKRARLTSVPKTPTTPTPIIASEIQRVENLKALHVAKFKVAAVVKKVGNRMFLRIKGVFWAEEDLFYEDRGLKRLEISIFCWLQA